MLFSSFPASRLRGPAQIVAGAGGRRSGGHARFVTALNELIVEQRDPAALREGEGAVVGRAEHQQIFLHLRKGPAEGGSRRPIGFGQLLKELRDPHGVVGIGLIVADGLVELGGGELHLVVCIDLVDAGHVAAPAAGGGAPRRPQAEGAGPEVGVHLQGGDA